MKASYGRYAIIGALLAGLLAAIGHISILNGMKETEQVLVVAKEIAPFQKIDKDSLRVELKPRGSVGDSVLRKPEDAVDHFSRTLLVPGQIVRSGHLADADGSAMAAQLTNTKDKQLRAMALEVTPETGVGQTLKAGDQVDVLVAVTVAVEGSKNETTTFSKVIARSVPVLYTSFSSGGITSSSAATVVLQVRPELAEEIAFIKKSGTIWLLTTPYVPGAYDTKGIDMKTFMQKYGLTSALPVKGGGN